MMQSWDTTMSLWRKWHEQIIPHRRCRRVQIPNCTTSSLLCFVQLGFNILHERVQITNLQMSICCCCWWQSAILCCLAQSGTFWNTLGFDQVSCTETYYIVPIIPFVPPKYTAPSLQRREIEKSQARPMNGSLHPPNYPKNPAIKRHALQKAGKTETKKMVDTKSMGGFGNQKLLGFQSCFCYIAHLALNVICVVFSLFTDACTDWGAMTSHAELRRMHENWTKLLRYNKM